MPRNVTFLETDHETWIYLEGKRMFAVDSEIVDDLEDLLSVLGAETHHRFLVDEDTEDAFEAGAAEPPAYLQET